MPMKGTTWRRKTGSPIRLMKESMSLIRRTLRSANVLLKKNRRLLIRAQSPHKTGKPWTHFQDVLRHRFTKKEWQKSGKRDRSTERRGDMDQYTLLCV